MKKSIITLVLMTWAYFGFAQSPLRVADINIPKNGEAELVIKYQFENEGGYTGYSLSISLPDGVSLKKNDRGKFIYTLGDCHEDTHQLTVNYMEAEKKYGVTCLSLESDPLTGTEGILLTFPVIADETLTGGQAYPATVQEINFAQLNGQTVFYDDVLGFNVNIIDPIDTSVVLDELSESVPEATDGAVDITVKRTIKANEWSTLCLPFNMTEEQVYAAFGQDVQLAEFVNYEAECDDEDKVIGIQVNFESTDLSEGFYANYPYMIKTSEMITEFTTNSTIDPDEEGTLAEYDNGLTGKRRKVYGSFIGTYHAQTTVPENGLFLSGNKFWYSTGNTKMKAFRAYFTFVDVLTSVEESGAKVNMNMVVGDATGINTVDHTARNNDGKVYNLQGQRVGKNFKGIVIENGRKVLK